MSIKFDLPVNMPVEADFAAESVVGNIDKEKTLKKNSFPIPGIVSKQYLFLHNTKTF